jgi:hydrogenase-4 component B
MSGVIIKMGIYGIVSFIALIPHPPVEWGAILLVLGVISGVLGVAFAIGQHDLKRLLAYHSIENIGIITMGIGLAMIGRSMGRTEWIILGMSGAVLHVWNHAVFKALLFLSAGSVIHAAHTREIDHLGGLAKRMPRTAFCFVVGAVAICGLPPLNGFISEYLIYVGLFSALGIDGGPSSTATAFAAPALALIGALALACFVKVYGAVFLGTARTECAQQACESGPSLIGPMSVLVICCFFIGMAPTLIAPIVAQAVSAWAPELIDVGPRLVAIAELNWISGMSVVLVGLLTATGFVLWNQLQHSVVTSGPTWGCGYAAPTPRMQYTSSSFAEMLVGLFAWALRPRAHRPSNLALFPRRSEFQSHVPDTVLGVVLPVFSATAWLFSWVRIFQQGYIHTYQMYIFVTLLVLLLWR